MLMDQALSQEDGLGTIPGVNDNDRRPDRGPAPQHVRVRQPEPGGIRPRGRIPGDGNAVSPDNMIWWNPPYYGYAEPLQYLPRHTEQYTVSRWTKVITWGSIKGTVRYNGAPVPNAHVWVYLPGGDTLHRRGWDLHPQPHPDRDRMALRPRRSIYVQWRERRVHERPAASRSR